MALIEYEQMKEIFNKGELVGEAMVKCQLMVENSVNTFFGKQVNLLILTHKYREIRASVYFIIRECLLHLSCRKGFVEQTRCRALEHRQGEATVHLVWAYGQKDHPLEKKHLQGWNGTKMYQSFFKLDEEDKDFQVVALLCSVFIGLSEKA